MRSFIFTRSRPFDIDSVKPRIVEIVSDFDKYLNSYPVKSSRSKHSLLGPVGKVLQGAKSGRWDERSLAGYALNIHLSNPKVKGRISAESREALIGGVGKLFSLLNEVPVTARDNVLDRIDYGLYLERRLKGYDWLDYVVTQFRVFLRNKYQTPEELAEAWNEKPDRIGKDFERLPYPSRRLLSEAKGAKKADTAEFLSQLLQRGLDPDENEEESDQ